MILIIGKTIITTRTIMVAIIILIPVTVTISLEIVWNKKKDWQEQVISQVNMHKRIYKTQKHAGTLYERLMELIWWKILVLPLVLHSIKYIQALIQIVSQRPIK